ncbi:amidohydrolase [Corynebacterium renale]|uniref:Hippurate hydrolase n=1 Tax=Corynebacterium renale TaxID=1724 RepID=A0A2A9DP40_9CORY|nr:amidohydrolase [Corynebacterium renale]PFG27945.1 hippurate hydrolase [Corynebacterium renale]SQI21585.1 peptidase [Corynebacterium renale]
MTIHAALNKFLESTRARREETYIWFHQHPELAFQEHETSGRIADELRRLGVDPIAVGQTGQVGVVSNGEGPTVLMRADFDGLPVAEESGKPYAADVELGRMHACGHDFHVTWLLAATEFLSTHRDLWKGTFIALFQPAEEIGQGALDMVNSGLIDAIPAPEVAFSQHVFADVPGGHVAACAGPAMSATANTRVTILGRGGHGSMPHTTIDPVVIAGHIITRLQTIVARELAPGEFGVVTIGAVHGGENANVIADSVRLEINTRAYNDAVHAKIWAAIDRIVRAECAAAGCEREPIIDRWTEVPVTDNDAAVTAQVMDSFREIFGERAGEFTPSTGSEDFSHLPNAWGIPYCYWGVGGFAAEDAPSNHSPQFAPDLHPTLDLGTQAIIAGVAPWLTQ